MHQVLWILNSSLKTKKNCLSLVFFLNLIAISKTKFYKFSIIIMKIWQLEFATLIFYFTNYWVFTLFDAVTNDYIYDDEEFAVNVFYTFWEIQNEEISA